MKLLFSIFVICFGFSAIAQNSSEEEKVKNTIETFFEGFHQQDSVLIKSVVHDGVIMQSIMKNREGTAVLHTEDFSNFLKSMVSIPAEVSFQEEIKEYVIKVDGDMASAWTPYNFHMNGNFSHCGVNNFQLYKDNGQWKIIYLVDTRRREGCDIN